MSSILQVRIIEVSDNLIKAYNDYLSGKISNKEFKSQARNDPALREAVQEIRNQGKEVEYGDFEKRPEEGKYVLKIFFI